MSPGMAKVKNVFVLFAVLVACGFLYFSVTKKENEIADKGLSADPKADEISKQREMPWQIEEQGDKSENSIQEEGETYVTMAPLLHSVEDQKKTGEKLRWLLEKRPKEYDCTKTVLLPNYKSTDSWTYCADPIFLPKPPCLVYSFGVNWDFSFEDAMEKLGCQVMSYDPSMDTVAHRHSPKVMFKPVGLGHKDSNLFVPHLNNQVKRLTQWQIRTLKTLVEENGHSEKTIDLLKYDIETYEWNVTRNLIDSGVLRNVKQLLLEWHIFKHLPRREQFLELSTVLQDLDKSGFKHFYKRAHGVIPNWQQFNVQSDMGYVNLNFTKR